MRVLQLQDICHVSWKSKCSGTDSSCVPGAEEYIRIHPVACAISYEMCLSALKHWHKIWLVP